MQQNNENANHTEKQQNRREFFSGFLTTLAIILPVCVAVYMMTTPLFNRKDLTSQTVSEEQKDVPIKAAKSYNLLWVLSSSEADHLLSVALLRFDVDQYRIAVCNFHYLTVVLQSKSPIDLSTLYAQRGALAVRDALEETLSIPISGYVNVDTDALTETIDALGELSYTLDKEVTVHNAEGLLIYSKPAGTNLFSGNDIANLITYGNDTDTDLMELHEQLWHTALLQYGNETFSSQLSDLYSKLVDHINTDINTAGIYALTKAVETVCSETGTQVEVIRPQGQFNGGRFELNAGADAHLWTFFSKI